MAKINEVHSVVVPANQPNLSEHVYTEVYGGQNGCTITINGTQVSVGGSSSIFINIHSVSGGSGCYLLGVNKNVVYGSPTIK